MRLLLNKRKIGRMSLKEEVIYYLLFTVAALISILALDAYPGNSFLFLSFCMVFICMWGLIWVGKMSYFYLFIASFWLLGFWMKASLHLILWYDFIEPVGLFDGSGEAWDGAIMLSLVAGLAAVLFRCGQIFFLRNGLSISTIKPCRKIVPRFYEGHRYSIWVLVVLFIVLVSCLNYYLGLTQSGMLPKHHLPFKLNAFIAWAIYSGSSLLLATLVWWEVCLGKKFIIMIIIFEGIVGSVSILSRSLYITHVFHYCFSTFFNRSFLFKNYKQMLLMLGAFFVGLGIVLMTVADLRRDLFYGVEGKNVQSGYATGAVVKVNETMANPQILRLLADRWIGLEGAMSISAYDDVGFTLFMEGWLDKPTYTTKPVYEKIAKSIYIDPSYPNADKYNFLSIPGLIAMLGYSGSLLVVALGVFLFLSIMALGEALIARRIINPFVVSFYGIFASMMLQQFGGLYGNLIQCFEFGSVLFIIWIVQNRFGGRREGLMGRCG